MSNTNPQHKEGPVAKAIEEQTGKIPSDIFLWTSLSAMSISFLLQMLGKKHASLFMGQWAAPFLILGLYNKLVKLQGHDNMENDAEDNAITSGKM